VFELRDTTAPDLVGILDRRPARRPAGERLELADLDAGLTAIGDREDLAGPDERARLRRVRLDLEARAADLLAE